MVFSLFFKKSRMFRVGRPKKLMKIYFKFIKLSFYHNPTIYHGKVATLATVSIAIAATAAP